ncbi:MAG: glycoside hydrolase family 3 protein [Sulfurimonas sp.]|uniref:glycoside hydrolase family 3 protein n=1 Tax=Sulfurimonas sp. TaxID=2022749 RepID=UPI0025ECC102|nr:glycoside hydrolase family 3 N-terminal domain-containing protein [Sulfurimonas sp.]MCK9492389.1 glycoside hydrolase family 3 protein [Sulfurimonas sp.]
MKYILILLLSFMVLNAQEISDEKLKQLIGRMLVVGFDESSVTKESQIAKDIVRYDLLGVILFDKFYNDRSKTKNIGSPKQLKKLTTQLQSFSKKPLLISVDQEGGKVARLKEAYGFKSFLSAKEVSKLSKSEAKKIYDELSQMLNTNGINCNFAPVVDLALNPKNEVIVGLERSYGGDPDKVSEYAEVFIDSLREHEVLSVIKHFPGHGSSLDDSHKGFVDVTRTWDDVELEPYKKLIEANKVDMIMTAHIFHRFLDLKLPATLSYKINTKLLREKLGYNGVIISDDMQMAAIAKHYSLEESILYSINAGVDILLFANQLGSNTPEELVETIFGLVKYGDISVERIMDSVQRIEKLNIK